MAKQSGCEFHDERLSAGGLTLTYSCGGTKGLVEVVVSAAHQDEKEPKLFTVRATVTEPVP